jgi:hypothetical protein
MGRVVQHKLPLGECVVPVSGEIRLRVLLAYIFAFDKFEAMSYFEGLKIWTEKEHPTSLGEEKKYCWDEGAATRNKVGGRRDLGKGPL